MLTLHALRIELGKSYRQTLDLLSEMLGILKELDLTRLPHFTALRNSFASISIQRWRAFLGASAEKRTGHATVDATGFDRDQPSRHYAQRAHYRVRSLKVTTLVDVEMLYVTNVHCTTTKKHDRRNASEIGDVPVGNDPFGTGSESKTDRSVMQVGNPRLNAGGRDSHRPDIPVGDDPFGTKNAGE